MFWGMQQKLQEKHEDKFDLIHNFSKDQAWKQTNCSNLREIRKEQKVWRGQGDRVGGCVLVDLDPCLTKQKSSMFGENEQREGWEEGDPVLVHSSYNKIP